mgnify:CR=1 FL=1
MTDISSGRREVDGEEYWYGADGSLIPADLVKPVDRLQDELVRNIIGKALPIRAMIAAFRQACFDEADDFVALLEQNYNSKRGGSKGNLTFTSYDALLKFEVSVGENISYGPELQVAKTIVDECLREWSQNSGPEIRAIVNRAFDVDQQNRVNHGALLNLMRLNIEDERWQKAMQAIRDSMRVLGSKRYVRMYHRPNAKARWTAISLDLASS